MAMVFSHQDLQLSGIAGPDLYAEHGWQLGFSDRRILYL